MKESSMVHYVHYNPDVQTLTVKFKSDPIPYVYLEVPTTVYNELLNADSIGRYLNEHVIHQYKKTREGFVGS